MLTIIATTIIGGEPTEHGYEATSWANQKGVVIVDMSDGKTANLVIGTDERQYSQVVVINAQGITVKKITAPVVTGPDPDDDDTVVDMGQQRRRRSTRQRDKK